MSLKAGGVGINLTAASNAFVMVTNFLRPAVLLQNLALSLFVTSMFRVSLKKFFDLFFWSFTRTSVI